MDKKSIITIVEEKLIKTFDEQKYLSEDEIISCSNKYDLTLNEIDKVCDRLLKKSIKIQESVLPNVEENVLKTSKLVKAINNDEVIIEKIFCEYHHKSQILRFALVRFGKYIRYDIRKWYDDGTKPGKGIALTYDEIIKLRESVMNLDVRALDYNIRAYYTGGKANATIYERICLCSEFSNKGATWNKEVSIVDWGYGLKVDFRKWAADYSVCGKGVAVTFQEAEEIFNCIKGL